MTQTEQNSAVRTRDEQVKLFGDMVEELGSVGDNSYGWVRREIEAAEARGAAEQRRKDAEGQEPVAWRWRALPYSSGPDSSWPGTYSPWYLSENDPFPEGTESPIKEREVSPLYTRPANVAALEARIAELEEAEQFARADAVRFAWVAENTGCFWYGLPGFGPVSGRSYADRMKDLRSAIDKNMARAALTREGGV